MPLRQRNCKGSSLFQAPDLRVILHPTFRLCVDVAVRCNAELLRGLPAIKEDDVQNKVKVSRKLGVLQPAILPTEELDIITQSVYSESSFTAQAS
eukprot:13064-Heterococcus_DN1.PRE.4